MKSTIGRVRLTLAATALLLVSFVSGGCGGGKNAAPSGGSVSPVAAAASRGTVAFTIRWPAQTTAKSRLLPTASKAIKFSVVEYDAPNNVVVLTKTAARPSDDQTTSTVLLDGLPTVLVNIQADAVPNADGTGVVQASALLQVQVEQNKTLDKTITLDSTIKKVEVTAAAPVTIGADGKFSLNLSDTTNPDALKAALTATAYNAAHEVVLTALDKWVYKSEKPGVAMVSDPSPGRAKGKTRAEGIGGAQATVTAISDGDSVITITESESQVQTQVTASVVGGKPFFWNQAFGDAQNSSCSSGRRAAGMVAATFEVADPNYPGSFFRIEPYTATNLYPPFVESPAGNFTFFVEDYGNLSSAFSRGIVTVSKNGASPSYTPQNGQNGAYGLDGTYYNKVYDFTNQTDRLVATGPSAWVLTLGSLGESLAGSYCSQFTISGDGASLYFTAQSNRYDAPSILYALDAHTGQIRWKTSGGNYIAKPAVSLDNATVYCRSDEPSQYGVVAFDAATGIKRWENKDDGDLSKPIDRIGVGPTGIVYSNGITDKAANVYGLRAINPATGQTLWAFNPGNPSLGGVNHPVLSRNGNVYGYYAGTSNGFGGGTRILFALNGKTGATLWKKEDSADDTLMGAGDGTLYFVRTVNTATSGVQTIVALDGSTGADLFTVTPNVFALPNIASYGFGRFTLQAVDGSGAIYASTFTSTETYNHSSSAISVIK